MPHCGGCDRVRRRITRRRAILQSTAKTIAEACDSPVVHSAKIALPAAADDPEAPACR